MPVISFHRDGDCLPLANVDALSGELLLDLVRQYDIPLHWRCGQGTCGTCRIRLKHAGQPTLFFPSSRERNVLRLNGVIDESQAALEQWSDTPSTWRLACYCPVGDSDWVVYFPNLISR